MDCRVTSVPVLLSALVLCRGGSWELTGQVKEWAAVNGMPWTGI